MRRLVAALVVCTALAACSSGGSPAADLQTKMNAVTDAANAKDAAQLRIAVSDFLQEVAAQSQSGDITSTKAQDLRTVAARVLTDASLLDQAAPTQAPTQAPPPAPSPEAPSPTSKPSPSPEPTQAPPSPSPIVEITTGPSSSP